MRSRFYTIILIVWAVLFSYFLYINIQIHQTRTSIEKEYKCQSLACTHGNEYSETPIKYEDGSIYMPVTNKVYGPIDEVKK